MNPMNQKTRTDRQPKPLHALLGLLLGFGWLSPAHAQDKPAEKEKPHFPRMDEIINPGAAGKADPQARMRELFSEVEANLNRVDILLSDAAAGDTARLKDVAEAGIGKLLNDSLKRGRKAQAQIAEIIELAKQAGKGSGSGSGDCESGEDGPGSKGKSGSSSQDSPLDRGQQRQSSEQTPEMGGDQKPAGQKPGEQGSEGDPQDPGGEKPGEKGKDPKDPGKDDQSPGKNRAGDDNGKDAGAAARQAAEAREGWGDLPSHVKDTFRSQGRSELPARYRDWIDEYYRKLNRRGDK